MTINARGVLKACGWGTLKHVAAWALTGLLLATGCARRSKDVEAGSNPQREERATTQSAPSVPVAELGALAQVAELALPSVVSVASTRVAEARPELPFDNPLFRRFFGPDGQLPFPTPPGDAPEQQGLGSGVIVGPNLILTNAHVVDGASRLDITDMGNRRLEAELVGSDPKSDLAVLRVTGDTPALRPIVFADSARVRLGDIVLAIGNPFGVGQTVTMGIVSAKGRQDLGIVDYEDFIQTDAAINPGNSGGALVNVRGQLIGIPTAILSRTGGYMGVGFAIPSNMARPIMNSLVEHGRVMRGYLGVSIQDIDPEIASALGLASTEGVLVADVSPDSPAAEAGLRRGDVVVAIDGTPVQSSGQLRNLIAAMSVGKTVRVEYLRGNQRQGTHVALAEMPGQTPEAPEVRPDATQVPNLGGLSVAPLDSVARKSFGIPADVAQGVVVIRIRPGTPASRAGLRPGDVLLEMDKQPIENAARLSELWKRASKPTPLLVWRAGRTFYAVIQG